MTGNPIRLRKAAQEFNVGTSTIIEFLEKKGHVLEDNPNTKIPEELYNLLVVEFKKDKETKLGAEKINIGNVANRQTVTIADKPKKDQDDEVKWESTTHADHLMIRDTSLSKEPVAAVKPEEKQMTPKPEAENKSSIKGPVIIDKIDLASIEPVKPKKKTAVKKETEKPAETVAKQEEKNESEPIVEEVVKPAVEEVSKEKIVKAKPEPEKIEIKTPEIKLTVLGSIDVESLRTKPKKKSVADKEREKAERKLKEKEAKKAAAQKTEQTQQPPATEKQKVQDELPPAMELPQKEEPQPEKVQDDVIRVRVPQMQGPKILATIDLKQFDRPPKPVASSSDDSLKKGHKKKRPRTETGAKTAKPTNQQQQHPQRKEQHPKPVGQQPQSAHPKKEHPKHAKKRPVKLDIKVVPTEEEIKKQISETLNKLTSTNKSKTSKHRKEKRESIREKMAFEAQKVEAEKNILKVTEFITANELASMMDIPVTSVIKKCMEIGLFVSINQRLDAETIVFIADEFGYQVTFIDAEDQENKQEEEEESDNAENLLPRHPVVTVMGHVDHGKTKLLDYIRHSNVVAGEAGGITQHIGAYSVMLDDGRKITFLDTPGHEAFTAMRARGAKITDVAIIVIAADDDVMPQTKEAINHAQAANVPIVFAINKIDKPTADPDKIRQQLSSMNILVEEWGGKYQCQEISAKAGTNVDLLLEKVLLEAEVLELKANPNRPAKGSVIESKLEPGRGYVASVLVQNGTLRKSDIVLAGQYYGRIKALFNERYQPINEVSPATPALILGLNGAPQAGDTFSVMKEERDARIAATKRQQLQREIGLRTQKHITLDDIGRNIARGSFKELNIIVKGDVDGSVEALADSLLKLSSDEVKVSVIHKSVGAIIESDVLLASASNAVIVGFQVRPSVGARKLAESEEIDIRLYSIIYDAIEEIKSAIEGMLAPEIKEDVTCNVEVREIFKIHKMGTIAGCLVLDGTITRDTKVRIIRDGIVIYTGMLGSLKRYKDDVKEVRSGMECGLNINNFNDIKIGDIIEGYKETEVKRMLN